MSSFKHNGTFGFEDDRGSPCHYALTLQAPSIANSSGGDLDWICEPPRESNMPIGLAPATTSWSTATFTTSPFCASVYGGSAWPGNQPLDGAPFRPSFGASDENGLRTNSLVGFEVAHPLLEQALPAVQTALPAAQPCPPNWAQTTGPPWQPVLPVGSTMQNGARSIDSLGVGLGSQLAASFMATGRWAMPTGCPSPTATPHSVRSFSSSDPVPVSRLYAASTSQPRGERWNMSDLPSLTRTTFPCLWASGGKQCTALVAGDRRSVTSHLRDAHNFACDSLTIVCGWDQCTTRMQRRNIPRHVVACHLEIKVTCEHCGMALSRVDANKKHQLACAGSALTRVAREADVSAELMRFRAV